MSEQWRRCESTYGGWQCTRQAGHVGMHHNTWHEWGSRDV